MSSPDNQNSLQVNMKIPPEFSTIAQVIKEYEIHNRAVLRQWTMPIQELKASSAIVDFMKSQEETILSIRSKFLELSKLASSPVYQLANSASLSIVKAITNVSEIGTAVRLSKVWEQSLNINASINPLGATIAAINLQLVKNAEFTALAQGSLARVQWDNIGKVLKLEEERRNKLRGAFLSVSQSYSSWVNSFERSPQTILKVSPIIAQMPSVEFFSNARLMEKISAPAPEEEIEPIDEELHLGNEIDTETQEELPMLLAKLDKDFIPVWKGAISSLQSDNSDRVRHFSVSVRELFTQVLHILAPDKEIRKWASSPEYFVDKDINKLPTRQARLLYIYQGINNGSLRKFIDKDISMFLEFLDLFQRGTHELMIDYTENQIKAMQLRAAMMLRYLIEISQL